MKPITVPRGVSRPSSNGSVGGDAGDPVEAAGACCPLCARTKAGHTTLSASKRTPSLVEMRNNLATTLCISISAYVEKGQFALYPASEDQGKLHAGWVRSWNP